MLKPTKPKVLIIEDDVIFSQILQEILNQFQVDSKIVNHIPSDFSTTSITDNVDLILLDRYLGNINGLEICKGLKNNADTQNIPVVMMSGQSKIKEKCIAAGAEDFLPKPFDMNDLKDILDRSLGVPV